LITLMIDRIPIPTEDITDKIIDVWGRRNSPLCDNSSALSHWVPLFEREGITYFFMEFFRRRMVAWVPLRERERGNHELFFYDFSDNGTLVSLVLTVLKLVSRNQHNQLCCLVRHELSQCVFWSLGWVGGDPTKPKSSLITEQSCSV